MKNVRSIFSSEQNKMLEEIGITFSDDIDYSDDELIEIHEKITDHYVTVGFDKNGDPTEKAYLWEKIIDLMYDELGI